MNLFVPKSLDKNINIEERIRLGLHSKTLNENPAFCEAIRQMYMQYSIAEDKVTMENNGDAGKHRYHYSMMRTLLLDLVDQLDVLVQEAENLKYGQEQEQLELNINKFKE